MAETIPGRSCAQVLGLCNDLGCIDVLMDSIKVRKHGKPCDPDITNLTNPICYAQNDLIYDF